MKWCLGTADTGVQHGSVSSLAFNVDCSRLLVGYAKGQITMWDLTNGKLLRTISDAHPLGQAVLHVKFTDSLTRALCSDSGGSVFDLEFTWVNSLVIFLVPSSYLFYFTVIFTATCTGYWVLFTGICLFLVTYKYFLRKTPRSCGFSANSILWNCVPTVWTTIEDIIIFVGYKN